MDQFTTSILFAMMQFRVRILVISLVLFLAAVKAQDDDGACRVIVMLPFTSSYKIPDGIPVENENQYNFFSRQSASRLSFSYAAAVLFAMNHFNNRDASIVPEIANIDPSCSIYFTEPTFVDSQVESGAALRGLYEAANATSTLPCAVLGTVEGESNTHIMPAINSYRIPLLSYYTEDAPFLTSEGTVGLTLSAYGRAAAMVKFLKAREYLAFWYDAESERESALAEALVKMGGNELRVSIFRVLISDNIKERLQQLKDSGIKSIYLSVLKPADLMTYAVLLDELDMLELAYTYILPPDIVPTDFVGDLYGEHEPGTPRYKLLSGAMVFDRLDGFRVDPDNDKFLKMWIQQGNETVSKLNSIVPKSAYYLAAPNYFQSVKPSNFASFVYDAVMSIGFGACIAEKEAEVLAAELEARGSDPQLEKHEVDEPLQEVEGFDVALRDETDDELESNEGTTQPFPSQSPMPPPVIQKPWIKSFTPSRSPIAEKTVMPVSMPEDAQTTMNFIPTTTRSEGFPTPNPMTLPPTLTAAGQTQSPVQLPVPTESILIPSPVSASLIHLPVHLNLLTMDPVNVSTQVPVQEKTLAPSLPLTTPPFSLPVTTLPERPSLNFLVKRPRAAISLPPIISPRPLKRPRAAISLPPIIPPWPVKRPRAAISLPPIIPPWPIKRPRAAISLPPIIPPRPIKRPRAAISLPPIIPPWPVKRPRAVISLPPIIPPWPVKRPRAVISLPPIIPPRLPPITLPVQSPSNEPTFEPLSDRPTRIRRVASQIPSNVPTTDRQSDPPTRARPVASSAPFNEPKVEPLSDPPTLKRPIASTNEPTKLMRTDRPTTSPFAARKPPPSSPTDVHSSDPTKAPSNAPNNASVVPPTPTSSKAPRERLRSNTPSKVPSETPAMTPTNFSATKNHTNTPLIERTEVPTDAVTTRIAIDFPTHSPIAALNNDPPFPSTTPTNSPPGLPFGRMGRKVASNMESQLLTRLRGMINGAKLNSEVSKTKGESARDLLTTQNSGGVARGTLLAGILATNFHGASGMIDFGSEIGKERNAETIAIGIYNIRPGNVSNLGKQSFYAALVFSNNDSEWVQLNNQAIVYRDGSIHQPMTRRVFVEENYLSPGIRAIGLVLMAIAWVLGFAALLGLHVFIKDAIIQRAQPFFLKMLCYGSVLTSTAIFTLSWDEGAGWSDRQLNIACAMTPWFFFFGIILTFCALFTKLWRVDKVLQFRRRAVTISNVMKPCVAIMTTCLLILIFWTALDPWTWERDVINEIPPESYGKCTSQHFWVWFGPLIGLLFFAEGLTMYFAWKTADIPDDFRDSGAVMYASFAQMQSWAFGIPMLAVLGNSSSEATYFGRICLIWIFAVSSVVLVIWPKLISAFRIRRNPALGKQKDRVHVSGLFTTNTPIASQQSTQIILDTCSRNSIDFGNPSSDLSEMILQ